MKCAIDSDYGSLFGMDVHARSVTVRDSDRATGEEIPKTFVNCPAAADVAGRVGERPQGGWARVSSRPTTPPANPSVAAIASFESPYHAVREPERGGDRRQTCVARRAEEADIQRMGLSFRRKAPAHDAG